MQAKISAGNDCLRFSQVTGRNFPAPADKLGEAFIVPVRSAFLEGEGERHVSFYPVPNSLTKVTTCCFWSQWWTLQKSWTVPCWFFKPLYKKNSSLKKSSLPSKWSRTGYCQFFGFLTHIEWRRDNQQK